MEYLTLAECAEKWNVSQSWVAIYCKEGRMWFILVGTEKPIDPRKARKLERNRRTTGELF